MPGSMRVLIVEDSEDDTALLVRELSRGGYEVLFERVDSAEAMDKALEEGKWDLIISDYSLPHFRGTSALSILREKGLDLPFIFVSGTMGEDVAVAAMRDGAHDYIMKGNFTRLVPAIQRELREAEMRRERKHYERRVQQLEKFEAIGKLAGGIAHDFNNLIGAVMGWAELGLQGLPLEDRSYGYFQRISEQCEHAVALTRQLLAFARHQVLEPQTINLTQIVTEAAPLLRGVIGQNIHLTMNLASEISLTQGDTTQLRQVLMNLCANAKDAMPEGGEIVIEARNVEIGRDSRQSHADAYPGSYVLLSVSDTGAGMDAATLEKIFEPFFTTKEAGKGIGLGLATVYAIVKQHKGFIDVESDPGHGSVFRICLPAGGSIPERSVEEFHESLMEGPATILLAEDNASVREMVRETLQELGYLVLAAPNGEDALRIFEQNPEGISLVLLDVVMPKLNGPETLRRMAQIKPGLRAILATAYAEEAAALTALARDGAAILQKPYSRQLLARKVRELLNRTP